MQNIFAQENSRRTDVEQQLRSKQKEKEYMEQLLTIQDMELAQLRREIQKVTLLLTISFNPWRVFIARITIVAMCVRLSVTTLVVAWRNSMLKLRYAFFLIFDS